MSSQDFSNNSKKSKRYDYWSGVVETLVSKYEALNKACEAASKSGTLDPNGPLFEAIWSSFESMLSIIDRDGWIAWYIYDNECGKKKLKASYGKNKPIKIDSNLKLIDLIIETEKI
jgi:hypothetical protein